MRNSLIQVPTPPATARAPQAPGAGAPGAAPVTAPVANTQVAPVEQLQAQLADMTQQVAGFKAQRVVMDRQLRVGRLDPGARAQLFAKRAGVDAQIAQLDADIANVKAQIAARQGIPVERVGPSGETLVPPPFRQRQSVDPEMVIGMSFALLMVMAIPMSIAFARRIWRGKPVPAGPRVDEIAPRLDRLEQAVDAIAIEVERISEGQRFVTKILADRPISAPLQTAKETPEEKPILALGAGPIEQVRVRERQAVKQSIRTDS